MSFCSQEGGGSAQPPQADPLWIQTPLDVDPPRQTPLMQTPLGRPHRMQIPLGRPPLDADPPGSDPLDTDPPGIRHKRVVRILLECILVFIFVLGLLRKKMSSATASSCLMNQILAGTFDIFLLALGMFMSRAHCITQFLN